MTTKEEREQAVIEAALEVWRERKDDALLYEPSSAMCKLLEAARALNAPQPVKPEEVEPGRLFRFADGRGPFKLIDHMTSVDDGPGVLLAWLNEDKNFVGWFGPEDLIIPLEGEQP